MKADIVKGCDPCILLKLTLGVQVQRLSKGEQIGASLRNKSRQYESRKLNVSPRNRQLEVGGVTAAWRASYSGSFQESLKELTVQYNREKGELQMEGLGGPDKHGHEEGGRIARERRAGYTGCRVRTF